MKANEGNSSDKTYYEGQVSESVLTKLASLMLKAKYPNAITDFGKWMTCFSSLKSLSQRISGWDSCKGEGYNTLGVCHPLSSGFELKYGMLSDNQEL